MKTLRKAFLPFFLLLVLTLPLLGTGCAHTHTYVSQTIEPTCTTIGYTIHTCACGEVYYSDYQAAVPHEYSEWKTVQEPTLIYPGEECCSCIRCGNLLTRDIVSTSNLPQIRLSHIIGIDQKGLSYSSSKLRFSCRAVLSETAYVDGKPDYLLSLCDASGNPYSIDLGWGQSSLFALKGYGKDATRTREEACAHFWKLLRSSDGGEPDLYLSDGSYPVQLYVDDDYAGLFVLSRPDGYSGTGSSAGRLVFQQTDETKGSLFKEPAERFEETGNGFAFRSDANPGKNFTEEDAAVAWNSFLNFQSFVLSSSDSDFVHHLDRYADVDELIDFFLFSALTCASGAGETRLLWYTDDGVHWGADYSTLETSIGLTETGGKASQAFRLPGSDGDGHFTYSGNHLLWDRLTLCFAQRITDRYHQIRESLSAEAFLDYFTAHFETIHPDLLKEEAVLFPDCSSIPDATAVETFITARFERMDTHSIPKETAESGSES